MQLRSYLALYFPLWDLVHFIRLQDNAHLIPTFLLKPHLFTVPNLPFMLQRFKNIFVTWDLAYDTPPLKDMSLALFLPPNTPQMPSSLGGLPISDTCGSSSADPPLNSYNLISLFA